MEIKTIKIEPVPIGTLSVGDCFECPSPGFYGVVVDLNGFISFDPQCVPLLCFNTGNLGIMGRNQKVFKVSGTATFTH